MMKFKHKLVTPNFCINLDVINANLVPNEKWLWSFYGAFIAINTIHFRSEYILKRIQEPSSKSSQWLLLLFCEIKKKELHFFYLVYILELQPPSPHTVSIQSSILYVGHFHTKDKTVLLPFIFLSERYGAIFRHCFNKGYIQAIFRSCDVIALHMLV